MARVAKLTADLFLNSSRFEAGTKRSQKSFKGLSKTIKKGAKASALAVAGITTALAALTLRQSAVIDETAKLSKALGVNIREFQALALAASEAGITQDQVGTIITKSQRSIVEAARGLETYARSFKTLNLDAKELLKLSPEEQFKEIAKALTRVDNATIRTATALEIFGRSGRQVNNMLDDFVENLDNARAFNDKFGISLNKIDAGKVEEARDTFARARKVLEGLTNTIAVQLAPIVTHLSNLFIQSGVDGETFGSAVASGMRVAGIAIDIVRQAMLGLRITYQAVIFTVTDLTAKMSLVLFDLGENIAKTFNMIPGVSLEAEKGLLKIGLAARKMADQSQKGIGTVLDEMQKFETTASRIAKIQFFATQRQIAKASDTQAVGLESINILLDEQDKKTNKLKKTTTKLSDLEKKRIRNAKELGFTFSSAFEDAIAGGEKFSDVLAGIAKDIEKILLRRIVTEPLTDAISGFALGGGGGGFLSNLFSFLPSFDTGTSFVPQDMIAKIHKGERVLTAEENKSFSSGGGGVNVIINNNTSSQVSTQARDTGKGIELNVMIDQAVADNIGRQGSRTNQAMKQFSSKTLIRR